MTYETLKAKNATAARREARERFPQGGTLKGYDRGECVYIATVREVGNDAPTATAIRNRSQRPTTFTFQPEAIKS